MKLERKILKDLLESLLTQMLTMDEREFHELSYNKSIEYETEVGDFIDMTITKSDVVICKNRCRTGLRFPLHTIDEILDYAFGEEESVEDIEQVKRKAQIEVLEKAMKLPNRKAVQKLINILKRKGEINL